LPSESFLSFPHTATREWYSSWQCFSIKDAINEIMVVHKKGTVMHVQVHAYLALHRLYLKGKMQEM